MVKGLEVFRQHFQGLEKYYTIIGGTACDCWISNEELKPRATKDIDLLIVLEQYNEEFNRKLWDFISDAGYESMQKEMKDQKFYRFEGPANEKYPVKLELLCRDPKIILIPEGSNITTIDLNEDLSHLSVMVLSDEYYQFTISNSYVYNGLRIARVEALICLKAKAYLNLNLERLKGKTVNTEDINKHWRDVFRLTVLLKEDDVFDIPDLINIDMLEFINQIIEKNPDVTNFLKSMGITEELTLADLTEQLQKSFILEKSIK